MQRSPIGHAVYMLSGLRVQRGGRLLSGDMRSVWGKALRASQTGRCTSTKQAVENIPCELVPPGPHYPAPVPYEVEFGLSNAVDCFCPGSGDSWAAIPELSTAA